MVEDMRNEVAKMKAEQKPEREIRLLQLMVDEPKITAKDLNKIENKVLVIAGEKDIILPSHTEFIAKEIPNSTLKIYKNANHSIPIENAEELNKDVIDFLKN